jgi:L-lysine 2,3-aminomutase
MFPKYVLSISELDNLIGSAPNGREKMETVTDLFPFRSNSYYLSLIDRKDRHDPLKRIILPGSRELKTGGSRDPSCEKYSAKKPGLQHKYNQTGLLLLTDLCGGICHFCFGKRLFMRYYRPSHLKKIGKVMVSRTNAMARWFDDYHHALTDLKPKKVCVF